MNLSNNETLGRTILTSGMVLVASLSLLVFGGPVLRDFALVLTVGVIIGTYSSIYIAGALTLEINQRWPGPKF
jgi:preprotein translocase subunit SecF